jgi:hypothetical protein
MWSQYGLACGDNPGEFPGVFVIAIFEERSTTGSLLTREKESRMGGERRTKKAMTKRLEVARVPAPLEDYCQLYWLLGSSVPKNLRDGERSPSPAYKHRRVGVQSEVVNSILMHE